MTESKRGAWRLSPARAAIGGALLLGALPMWTLPLMLAGGWGFLAYLSLSHAYYEGARAIFGTTLFPAQEFGIIPSGVGNSARDRAVCGARSADRLGDWCGRYSLAQGRLTVRAAGDVATLVVALATAGPAVAQQPDVIQLAQRVLVSSLDSSFPRLPLGEWLARLPGSSATAVRWETNDCGEGGDGLAAPTCVEALLQVAPDTIAHLSLVVAGIDGTPGAPAIWMLYATTGRSSTSFKGLSDWVAFVRHRR